MKIKIEVDITPQETRAALGLPDVEPLQREVLDKVRNKMTAGLDALDPMNVNPMKMMESYFSVYPSWMEFLKKGSAKETTPAKEAKDKSEK